jgi:hypothetical protein
MFTSRHHSFAAAPEAFGNLLAKESQRIFRKELPKPYGNFTKGY